MARNSFQEYGLMKRILCFVGSDQINLNLIVADSILLPWRSVARQISTGYLFLMADKKVVARERDEDGTLEFVEVETGKVVGVQMQSKKNKKRIAEGKKPYARKASRHWRWKKNKNGTPLLVPYNVDAKNLPDNYSFFNSDKALCLDIALLVSQGETLSSIARMEGMPPSTVIFNWYYRDEDFKGLVDEARKMRAEFYHDKIHDVAEDATEDNSKSSKVKLDAYAKLASWGDRDRFGNQTKITGDANQPVSFVFNTGINRPELEDKSEEDESD